MLALKTNVYKIITFTDTKYLNYKDYSNIKAIK